MGQFGPARSPAHDGITSGAITVTTPAGTAVAWEVPSTATTFAVVDAVTGETLDPITVDPGEGALTWFADYPNHDALTLTQLDTDGVPVAGILPRIIISIDSQLATVTDLSTAVVQSGDALLIAQQALDAVGTAGGGADRAYVDSAIGDFSATVDRRLADDIDNELVLDISGASGSVTLNMSNRYDADGTRTVQGYRNFRIRPDGSGPIDINLGTMPLDSAACVPLAVIAIVQPSTPVIVTWETRFLFGSTYTSPPSATALATTLYHFSSLSNSQLRCTAKEVYLSSGTGPATPAAPTLTNTGTAGAGKMLVSWAVPANGGQPITNTQVVTTDTTTGATVPVLNIASPGGVPPTSVTISGLTPGHGYKSKVRMDNINGSSSVSAFSSTLTLATSAGATTGNLLLAQQAQVTTDPNPGGIDSKFESRVAATIDWDQGPPSGWTGNAFLITSTSSTAGVFSGLRTQARPATAGQRYSLMLSVQAVAASGMVGKNVSTVAYWRDGAGTVISTIVGPQVTITTGIQQVNLTNELAPAGTASVSVGVRVQNVQTIDGALRVGKLGLFDGSVTVWTPPATGVGPGTSNMWFGMNLFGSNNYVDPTNQAPGRDSESVAQNAARVRATFGRDPDIVKLFHTGTLNAGEYTGKESLVAAKRSVTCFKGSADSWLAGSNDAGFRAFLGALPNGYNARMVYFQEPWSDFGGSGQPTWAKYVAVVNRVADLIAAAFASGLLNSTQTVVAAQVFQGYDLFQGTTPRLSATQIAAKSTDLWFDIYANDSVIWRQDSPDPDGKDYSLTGRTYPSGVVIVNAVADWVDAYNAAHPTTQKTFGFAEMGTPMRLGDIPSKTGLAEIGSARARWYQQCFDTARTRGALGVIPFNSYNYGLNANQLDYRFEAAAAGTPDYTLDHFGMGRGNASTNYYPRSAGFPSPATKMIKDYWDGTR